MYISVLSTIPRRRKRKLPMQPRHNLQIPRLPLRPNNPMSNQKKKINHHNRTIQLKLDRKSVV